ncbi:MAG: hypothetical protein KDA45_11610, partial [Planctomycetales bacterium]|nr:hypothetical protein [Planctomycetales bacterium]
MFLQEQVSRFSRWLGKAPAHSSPRSSGQPLSAAGRRARKCQPASAHRRKATRTAMLEAMEPRCLMAADLIQIGSTYIEEDLGSDAHGDTFYVTFSGGAAGTQLTRLEIDGDLNTPGFGLGDLFFDTLESGRGADHAFPFQIEQLNTANPNASVRAFVEDGSSLLVLEFTNFVAGDLLVFSIDVDEVQYWDPSQTD